MFTVKDAFFDLSNEQETQEEHLRECIFIRDVIKNICNDTLSKARKANKCYSKLSKDMLTTINNEIGDREIRSAHYTYIKK